VNRIAQLDAAARAEIFAETANRVALPEALVEKDFWVCWTLAQIFTIEAFRENLLFKGGTSLSKVFGFELGTHAEFIPRGEFSIRSFAAGEFPKLFNQPDVRVTTLLARRTFWEKATILHAEFHRPAEKPTPARYSRHYYDVAMMAAHPVKDEACRDLGLLAAVVKHKRTFYPSAWAQYPLAIAGTLRLAPAAGRLPELRQDYQAMAVMIFGEPPSFDRLVETLVALENEINRMGE